MTSLEERIAALEAKVAALVAPRSTARVFTPERDAALRQHWEAGLRATEILPLLNALPAVAPVASQQAVTSRAMKLKLKRPPGWRAQTLMMSATTTWGPERRAALARDYGRIRPIALLDYLNTLPGDRIKNVDSMRRSAVRLGIRSQRLVPNRLPAPAERQAALAPEPEEPAPLTPEEQEAAVAEAWARKHARAMELFGQGKSAEAVAASIKVPLREACRLLGEYRNQAAGRNAA
jgi:hypothetical protein